MTKRLFLIAAALPLALIAAPKAMAEPQILGLIASAEAVPLQCDYQECDAELTAYCIEEFRQSPARGRAYYLYDPTVLALEGVREDGTTMRLAGDLAAITAERGHSAVRVSVPVSTLREFGVVSMRVGVGAGATLIPEPVVGDRNPHSEDDIFFATGPLRAAATAIIDHGDERLNAAQFAERIINELPRRGRTSDAVRDRVWERMAPPADAPGYALVREGFDRCHRVTRVGMLSLRQCLGSVHDSLIGSLNTDFWRAVGGGA